MKQSKNTTVCFLYNFFVNDRNSGIARNMFHITQVFDCNYNADLNVVLKNVKMHISDDHMANSMFLVELLQLRQGALIVDEMNADDINVMIEYVATN